MKLARKSTSFFCAYTWQFLCGYKVRHMPPRIKRDALKQACHWACCMHRLSWLHFCHVIGYFFQMTCREQLRQIWALQTCNHRRRCSHQGLSWINPGLYWSFHCSFVPLTKLCAYETWSHGRNDSLHGLEALHNQLPVREWTKFESGQIWTKGVGMDNLF